MRLLNKIKADDRLLKLIINAPVIISESAGAKVLGEYLRAKEGKDEYKIVPGLGILKNTIIEPHYSERNRHAVLIDDLKQTGMKYGIGIDTVTGMEFELSEFPDKYEKIGTGSVCVVKAF